MVDEGEEDSLRHYVRKPRLTCVGEPVRQGYGKGDMRIRRSRQRTFPNKYGYHVYILKDNNLGFTVGHLYSATGFWHDICGQPPLLKQSVGQESGWGGNLMHKHRDDWTLLEESRGARKPGVGQCSEVGGRL